MIMVNGSESTPTFIPSSGIQGTDVGITEL